MRAIQPAKLPYSRTIVIGASYSTTTKEVSDTSVREKAEKYKTLGRSVHKIERFMEQGVDNLKFLYPLYGVPLAVFPLINAANSSAEDIVLVGSRETGKVCSAFVDEFPQLRERVRFVHEGQFDKLSLADTVRRAYRSFPQKRDELVLWLPGDMPTLTGLESLLKDIDIAEHDAILDFNTQENLFPENTQENSALFSKTFHHTLLDYRGREVHIKEPNPWLLNLNLIDSKQLWPVFNVFYGSRRGGGVNVFTICSAFFPYRLRQLAEVSRILWKQRGNLKKRKVDFASLEEVADLVLDCRVKLKAEHSDLNRLNDIDSYEDHEFYEALFDYASQDGKLEGIYPHTEMLQAFRERAGKMNLGISPAYLNYRRQKLGLAPLYDAEGNLISFKNTHTEKAYELVRKN